MAFPFKVRVTIIAIGRRVRAHRIARHMTQRDLGHRARLNHKFISELELGAVNCSVATLLQIAEGLGCTLTQLIPDSPSTGYVTLTAENMRRVREAVAAIDAAITPRAGRRRTHSQ